MKMVIVPDSLRELINQKLDAALLEMPEAMSERDQLYHELLVYFDEHGQLPDFTIQKKEAA